MCLILEHTSLAQYGMSHLAKGMVVPVIGSLVVAFSLLCMAKEFTCLLAFQCGDCFNCCCHSYIIFRISIIMLTVIAKGEQRLLHASCLIALAAFTPQGRCKPNAMELVPIAEAQPVLAAFRPQRYKKFMNYKPSAR